MVNNLKQKRSQKKKMENELAMYRHQVAELRNDIEKISEILLKYNIAAAR